MFAIAFLFVRVLCDYFKPRQRLESAILVLRRQLKVLQQRAPRRLYLTWADSIGQRSLSLKRLVPRSEIGWSIRLPRLSGKWNMMQMANSSSK
jgi:hypothetical protein